MPLNQQFMYRRVSWVERSNPEYWGPRQAQSLRIRRPNRPPREHYSPLIGIAQQKSLPIVEQSCAPAISVLSGSNLRKFTGIGSNPQIHNNLIGQNTPRMESTNPGKPVTSINYPQTPRFSPQNSPVLTRGVAFSSSTGIPVQVSAAAQLSSNIKQLDQKTLSPMSRQSTEGSLQLNLLDPGGMAPTSMSTQMHSHSHSPCGSIVREHRHVPQVGLGIGVNRRRSTNPAYAMQMEIPDDAEKPVHIIYGGVNYEFAVLIVAGLRSIHAELQCS